MSFWKKIIDPYGIASDTYHAVTGTPTADEKRNQQSMINDQITAYKQQSEITQKQLADTQAEKNVEKRRINEKQIRSLRNSYRPAGGFLGNQGANLTDNSNITNKLGA